MPEKPIPLSQEKRERLRDEFALVLTQAHFTGNSNYPAADQRDALCRSIYEMADALVRARLPKP
jgi:hypothetical protein